MHEKRNTTILLLLYLLLEILVVFLTKQRYKSNKLLRNLDHLCFVPFRIAPINVSSAESSCQKIRWGIVAKAEPHWQFRMHDHSWGRVWPIDVRIFYLFKAHIPDEDMKMTLNENDIKRSTIWFQCSRRNFCRQVSKSKESPLSHLREKIGFLSIKCEELQIQTKRVFKA